MARLKDYLCFERFSVKKMPFYVSTFGQYYFAAACEIS